jgi:hypothetical protein
MCLDLGDDVSSSDEHDEVCMYVCRDVTGFEIRYNGRIDAAKVGHEGRSWRCVDSQSVGCFRKETSGEDSVDRD